VKVLVTGGAGFIGANLLRYWSEAYPGDELVTLDKLTYAGHRKSIASLEQERKLTFVQGDIADPEAVDRAMRGAELVLHLAAESHVDRSIADPAPFLRTNVLGTHILLEAARKWNVRRFHHVSTDEVFGTLPLDRPDLRFESDSPYAPRSPYAASKAASDHLVRAYHNTYALPVTISNCGNNFGAYQHPEKLIPRAITRALLGLKVPVYGDGRAIRDWIFVDDHVRALDAIAHRGQVGETYLVGAEMEKTNLEVVEKVLTYLGRDGDSLEFVSDRPGHDLRYSLRPSPNLKGLGWRPRVGFDEGLRSTVQWYKDNPAWWAGFVENADALRTPA
jgi:dTDP-glucose 4,6-dehydratase